MGDLGTLFTGLALAATLYAGYATYRGIAARDARWRESGRRALHVATALLGAALLVLAAALLTHHYKIRYVALHSSLALPVYLRFSAIWAGQEGSLLVWAFLQALFTVLAVERAGARARPLVPWATVILSVVTAFFTAVLLLLSNPFTQTAHTPVDGMGLNPLLRHPGMIFHPPAMYVGYVGLAVPFAFALAALITGQLQDWTRALRRWTLIAWLGLGLGLLLGMRWAYDVLGWGGYWGWDPVENAGLMPWLTTTALLHGAVMQDERRGFRLWNFLLVMVSFVLVLFGTYATRSGAIQSVHAYARSNLGGVYLGAIGVTLGGALALLIWRRPRLRRDDPPADERLLSRDGTFALTLILFGTLTISVFVGSVLPTLSQRLTGQAIEAGPAWFDRVTGPQFGALLLLLGVCPVLGRSSRALRHLKARWWVGVIGPLLAVGGAAAAGFTRPVSLIGVGLAGLAGTTALAEFAVGVSKCRRQRNEAPLNALWRLLRSQQRRYGGYLVHLGIILMAVGIIGTRMYPHEQHVVLQPGESAQVGDYTLTLERLHQDVREDTLSTWADVTVARGADVLTTLSPAVRRYANFEQSYGIPAIRPGLRNDLYLILAGWSEDQEEVTFQVHVNALANFLWMGGLVFLTGGALAFWPRTGQRTLWHVGGGIVVLALLLGAAWAMWIAPQRQAGGLAARPRVGDPAPDFRLTSLEGETLSLADLRGNVVVLNLWASWCPPCTEELPALQSVWTAYQDANVVFVGAAYREKKADVSAAKEAYGLTYPIGLDANNRIANAYGITGVPETYVIDADGRIAHVHIGPVTAEQLSQELAGLVR